MTLAPPIYPPPDKCQRGPGWRVPTPPAAKAAAPPDPAIAAIVAMVNAQRLRAALVALTGFPTRHTASPHNVEAAHWLRDAWQSAGYADVAFHDFTTHGQTRHNVVCTKPGTTHPDKLLVLGAHYDSRMAQLSDSNSNAPGADDNASGVAALLELARVLAPVPLPCTLRFVAFSGEEQGLVGSSAYAALAHASGWTIPLMVNLDMVGHPTDPAAPTIVVERDEGNARPENDAASHAFAERFADAAASYTTLQASIGPIYSSDYMPFEHFGYTCVGLFDGADNQAFYHTEQDMPAVVDAAYHAQVVRLLVAGAVRSAHNM